MSSTPTRRTFVLPTRPFTLIDAIAGSTTSVLNIGGGTGTGPGRGLSADCGWLVRAEGRGLEHCGAWGRRS